MFVFFLTMVIFLRVAKTDVEVLKGDNCRAIEKVGKTLRYDSISSFLLSFDLNLDLPVNFLKRYKDAEDELGVTCLSNINKRVNHTVQGVGKEVSQILDENKILKLFLNAPEFLGRGKRSSGVVVFAILSTIANLAATGFNIAYTSLTMSDFNTRLSLLADKVKLLEENDSVFNNNIELLWEQNQFMGVQKNLLIDHINEIKTVHSCNIIDTDFEALLHRLEVDLSNILEALHSSKFSYKIIDFKTLEILTSQNLFDGTIFQIAPSLLYEHASMSLVSYSNYKITFLVSFPRIGDEYGFTEYNVIEAPRKIGSLQDHTVNSFVVPITIETDDLENKISEVRSTKFCKRYSSYTFCPDTSPSTNCIASILKNANVSNDCPLLASPSPPPIFTYSRTGALINLQPKEDVIDLKTGKSIFDYDHDRNANVCVFVPKRSNLVLLHEYGQVRLFPNTRISSFVVKPKFRTLTTPKKPIIDNVTLDTFHSTKVYQRPKALNSFTDYWIVYLIAIGASVLISLIFVLLLICIFRRMGVVDGQNLFA